MTTCHYFSVVVTLGGITWLHNATFSPNRATHIPKMADTNQQSPPPQLGPVVSELFDPINMLILDIIEESHDTL